MPPDIWRDGIPEWLEVTGSGSRHRVHIVNRGARASAFSDGATINAPLASVPRFVGISGAPRSTLLAFQCRGNQLDEFSRAYNPRQPPRRGEVASVASYQVVSTGFLC